MKCKIIKTEFDQNALRSAILSHNGCVRYLIMSQETADLIRGINLRLVTMDRKSYLIKYMGIDIAICDSLVFGEVDIIY